MTIVRFPSKTCFPYTNSFTEFIPEELDENDDIPTSLIKAGGRSVLVVPMADVCAGEREDFQIVSGMGGIIKDALYMGRITGKSDCSQTGEGAGQLGINMCLPSGITRQTDCMKVDPDCAGGPNGDLGLAVRDLGQWYVTKISAEQNTNRIRILGGNRLGSLMGEDLYGVINRETTMPNSEAPQDDRFYEDEFNPGLAVGQLLDAKGNVEKNVWVAAAIKIDGKTYYDVGKTVSRETTVYSRHDITQNGITVYLMGGA